MKELNLNELSEISGGFNWGLFIKGFTTGAGIGGAVYVANQMA